MPKQFSTVKWFDAKKGYGFLDHPDGGDDVFVHYSQIESEQDFKTLRTGQQVEFELSDGPKGIHALSVTPMGDEDDQSDSLGGARPDGQTRSASSRRQPSHTLSSDASRHAAAASSTAEAVDTPSGESQAAPHDAEPPSERVSEQTL